MAKFDLKEAEKFVVEAVAETDTVEELEEKLNSYFKAFNKKIEIKFEEAVSDWLVKLGDVKKRADYPETIPKIVKELMD